MAMPFDYSTPATTPNPTEASFISSVATPLQQRLGTTAQAQAAGYYQMTKMERDGTIIWFNDDWGKGVSKNNPNFLWYDKAGKLVGLDYEYAVSAYPQHPGTDAYPSKASRATRRRPSSLPQSSCLRAPRSCGRTIIPKHGTWDFGQCPIPTGRSPISTRW